MKSHHRREVQRQYPELMGILGKETFEAVEEVSFQLIDKDLLFRHQTETTEFVLMSDDREFVCQMGRGLIPLIKCICRLGPDLIINAVQRALRSDVFVEYIVSLHAPEYQGDVISRPPRMVIHARPYATGIGTLVRQALAN